MQSGRCYTQWGTVQERGNGHRKLMHECCWYKKSCMLVEAVICHMQSLLIKCKNLVFNEVFSFLLFLIRSGVNTLQMKAFLHTLSSVLLCCGTALNAHKEACWLKLHPQKLLCSEVLGLLQHWATLFLFHNIQFFL